VDAEAGFTLLEMLVALALLAVIAALLVAAITSARQALNVVDRRGTQASVPAVQSVLRRLLVEARANLDVAEQAVPYRAFIGEPNKLGFVSSFVPQGQYGGLWRYEIALDASEGAAESSALVLTQQLVRPVSPATGQPLRTVLINEVRALSVRYFGAEDKDSAPQWQDAWRHPYRLPRLVSVDVTFVRADGRQWTTLTVAFPLAD
jgi:prepilin-type N-terminal cleavage/methylation domain-containing protein